MGYCSRTDDGSEARTQEETNQKKGLYDSWCSSAEIFPGEQNPFETFLLQSRARGPTLALPLTHSAVWL